MIPNTDYWSPDHPYIQHADKGAAYVGLGLLLLLLVIKIIEWRYKK